MLSTTVEIEGETYAIVSDDLKTFFVNDVFIKQDRDCADDISVFFFRIIVKSIREKTK